MGPRCRSLREWQTQNSDNHVVDAMEMPCMQSSTGHIGCINLYILVCLSVMPQMYLLQSPLRPPWRPYDLEAAESVRLHCTP